MALNSWHAQNLDDRQFFFAALKNYFGEIIFYGIIAVVIWAVSSYMWWVGFVFFVPFSLLALMSSLQSAVLIPSAFSALITERFIRRHGNEEEKNSIVGDLDPSHQKFAFGTALIGLLKSLICLGYSIWLSIKLFA